MSDDIGLDDTFSPRKLAHNIERVLTLVAVSWLTLPTVGKR